MNKYNLIEQFFKNYEDAVKFVVSLEQCGIANDDGNCIAILQKDNDTK